jgi:tetratricopeptide (TPR) repeat protein
LLYRGRAAQLFGAREKAVADYQQVLSMRPDQESAHAWLGEALMADTQLQEALGQFQTFLANHPNDADVLIAAATCQRNLSQLAEARATVKHLLDVDPNHLGGLSLQAKLDLSDEKWAKGLKALERARALGSRDMDVINNLAIAHRQLNHNEQANKYQKQVNELLKRNKEWSELTRKIHENSEDVALRYQAGLLCLQRGAEGEAAHWFQTVLYINPDHRPTHQALADYWRQHGNPQRAAYHQRRAERNED